MHLSIIFFEEVETFLPCDTTIIKIKAATQSRILCQTLSYNEFFFKLTWLISPKRYQDEPQTLRTWLKRSRNCRNHYVIVEALVDGTANWRIQQLSNSDSIRPRELNLFLLRLLNNLSDSYRLEKLSCQTATDGFINDSVIK